MIDLQENGMGIFTSSRLRRCSEPLLGGRGGGCGSNDWGLVSTAYYLEGSCIRRSFTRQEKIPELLFLRCLFARTLQQGYLYKSQ